MIIPTEQELSLKIRVIFKKGNPNIEIIEDIYIKIFGQHYLIPKGFKSDGASIPKIFRGFISPYDFRWIIWAILHDYFYRTQFISRFMSDVIFYSGLKLKNKNSVALIFFLAVRSFGFIAWKRNKKKGLEKYPKAKHNLKKILCI